MAGRGDLGGAETRLTVSELHVVTGAFSYTGRYIAEELLGRGRRVRTLTRRPPDPSHPLAASVEAAPFVFDDSLVATLRGADTLYNTYWVRFERGAVTFDGAVANLRRLFEAAERAGVRRVVHVSVANPSLESPYPYFRGKAQTEDALRLVGVSHAIVRPTLVFGPEDILVNNIAWGLRHVPVYLIPGDGQGEVQPVSVRDTASICVEAGGRDANVTLDAAGPDRWTYDDFVRLIARAVGSRARIRQLRASHSRRRTRGRAVPARRDRHSRRARHTRGRTPGITRGTARPRAIRALAGGEGRLDRPWLYVGAGPQLSPMSRPLVLASTSPQRRAILEQLAIPFVAVPPDYVEDDSPDDDAVELVRRHAEGKARSVHKQGRLTLGVDTTVLLDGRVYGKAVDRDDAGRMLGELSGRTHTVVSGVCLLGADADVLLHETTDVTFRVLTRGILDAYLASGEWESRAGAYAIQGLGGRLVERIDGDYLNVVGLPGALLVSILERHAPDFLNR